MKNIKKILCLFILITVVCGDFTMEAQAWNGKNHAKLASDTFKKKIKHNYASKKELKLLYKCCKIPDDRQKYPGNFHGRNCNYVLTLKYLYELSLTYLNNKSKVDDKEFINDYFNNCSYIPENEKESILQIDKSLVELLSTKIKYKTKYEMNNRRKSIKIMGFACHFTGDTFAHMTIVPKKCIKGKNEKIKFHRSDFGSKSQWKTFKKIISKYEVTYGDIKHLWKLTVKKRNSNTYVKLSDVYGTKKLKAISKNLPAKEYEDNPDFNRAAFKGAYKVTNRILRRYNKALKKSKKHTLSYTDIKFKKKYLKYYKSKSKFKLYNFKEYMKAVD